MAIPAVTLSSGWDGVHRGKQHQLSLPSAFLYGNARADVHTLSLLGGEDYSHSPDEETQVWRVEVTNPGSQAGARIRTQIFLGRLAEVLQGMGSLIQSFQVIRALRGTEALALSLHPFPLGCKGGSSAPVLHCTQRWQGSGGGCQWTHSNPTTPCWAVCLWASSSISLT